jgi:hypothetical protein
MARRAGGKCADNPSHVERGRASRIDLRGVNLARADDVEPTGGVEAEAADYQNAPIAHQRGGEELARDRLVHSDRESGLGRATALPGGQVLIAGGERIDEDGFDIALAGAEIWPSSRQPRSRSRTTPSIFGPPPAPYA